MARSRKGKTSRKQQRRKRGNGRRRTNRSVRQAQPSVGKLIAKGVKSLVSSVPGIGKVLGDVADFGFKTIGLTENPLGPANTVIGIDVRATSQCARFDVLASSLLVGSRACIQMDAGRTIMTQYQDGRVIEMTVRIQPITVFAARAGDWTLAIQPFFNNHDESLPGLVNNWFPDAQCMHHMYLSCTGPASKPLQLTYRPRICDGRAYTFNPLDSRFAEVAILWENPIRTSYEVFSPTEFACETIISGVVETRVSASAPMWLPNEGGPGGRLFRTAVVDKLKDVAFYIINNKNASCLSIKDDAKFKCEDAGGFCQVHGTVISTRSGIPKNIMSLDDMILAE